jgi:hypothetical protein
MAPRSVKCRKARPLADLAFLVLCVSLALALASSVDQHVMAFVSPQSPVVPAGDETLSSLARSVRTVPDANPGWLGSAWRVRLGGGLIVLGVALVIGGLLWITDREALTGPGPPGAPGERGR